MSKTTLKVDNSDLKRWTGEATKRLRDLRAPLTAAGNVIEEKVAEQFQREVDPDGEAWEPLSPDTLKNKNGGSILVKTGALRDSFNYEVGTDTLSVSSSSPVFEIHDQGLPPIPQRQILGLNAEDKNQIAGLVKRYVKGSRR